jgi:hypothetical protein
MVGVLAPLVAGCEHQSQPPPAAGAPSARLIATSDFGATSLLRARVRPGRSVMAALRGATAVTTAFGGGFVSGMLGRRSDLGRHRDWFYFVNGIDPQVGARETTLHAGDTAWWDFRPWRGAISVPAVVGAWPEPFVHGLGRPPARVSADRPLAAPLRSAGAAVGSGPSGWRVRVGADADLRRQDPAWRRASADPSRTGLVIAVRDGRVTALAPDGSHRRPVPGAAALAAAVTTGREPGDGVLLAVAGLDAGAARAAARRIARDPTVLQGRYAVAFDATGRPLLAAGRDGP